MRKYIIPIILLSVSFAACGPKDGVKAIRAYENTEADLGIIKEIDGPVTVRLLCRNDYADTLYPVRFSTPCGCTQLNFDRTPVPPGEDQVLEIEYNPKYRPGPMMEEVQVYYVNSPVRTRAYVIKGFVVGYSHPIEEDRPYHMGKGLYMSHTALVFGGKHPGESGDIFFRYGNGNKKKASVTYDIPEQWQPYVHMRQPGKMKADERDTIHVKFTMPENIDTVAFYIQPKVNGTPTEKRIYVNAYAK